MDYYQTAELSPWLSRFYEPLAADEALHNLIIGLAEQMQLSPPVEAPFLGGYFEQGQACLAALKIPGWILLLGACSSQARTAIVPLVQALNRQNIAVPGVNASADLATAFAEAWQLETGARPVLQIAQQVYRLNQTPDYSVEVSGRLSLPQPADIPLLAQWYAAFIDEASPDKDSEAAKIQRYTAEVGRLIAAKALFVWRDQGHLVAMIGLLRQTRRGVALSLAYTPPEFRGQGYGSACLAALSAEQLKAGKAFCCLYADTDNPTTNKISRQLGYEFIAESRQYAFEPSARSARSAS